MVSGELNFRGSWLQNTGGNLEDNGAIQSASLRGGGYMYIHLFETHRTLQYMFLKFLFTGVCACTSYDSV